MSNQHDVTNWINELADRPETSMENIWQAYYERLVGYARRKLGEMPRRHIDEEDIAIDAMNSLFNGMQAGRFPDLNDRDDLWKLLLTITARKAGKAIRGNLAQKRGGGSIRGESVFVNVHGEQGAGIGNVLGREPSSELAEHLVEQCEYLFGALDDDVLKQIAGLKLEGYTNKEIAEKMNCAIRSIERKLNLIRAQWEASLSQD